MTGRMEAELLYFTLDHCTFLPSKAWSDPGLAPLRQDIAHRVLGVCKKKGRGILTVKLLQIGVRLAGRDDASWAGAGLFREAIEAVSITHAREVPPCGGTLTFLGTFS